ncbi:MULTISPECIES: hypothetical protein [unclassified Lysobacter]|uniref:hypothetical protein n=1 Tax=unclassified Lysobacter TaxID=2635362 RepID=UPI001BE50F55|nr:MULTISPECIES: hypothetical protein [unclassified Lysobacter]MBT2747631.1 hypothetical protein [Lysobacter sp. ISL-42]MBT2752290.1 hypothetical protein [Lysobacter sp. ISL-50]MBT2777451.1 hypothetical protein [Lysobacter sp. ISL-54]MBT2784403.1 hypothetical protein [Lysobacter sp. ISL-52]
MVPFAAHDRRRLPHAGVVHPPFAGPQAFDVDDRAFATGADSGLRVAEQGLPRRRRSSRGLRVADAGARKLRDWVRPV